MKEINNLTIKGTFTYPATTPTVTRSFGASTLTEDVTDKNYSAGTQTVGTSEEVLPLADVTTPKRVWIKNNGTFPVRFGTVAAQYPNEIAPLSQAYTGLNGAAVRVIAIGGSSDIEYFIGGV